MNGTPAITFHADSVYVVFPIATLLQAHVEGITTEDAVRAFLERYGQRCSNLIDLNAPHSSLRVRLSLQSPADLGDIDQEDEVLFSFRSVYLKEKLDPDVPSLFTVSPDHLDLTINYVPTRQVHCVSPGAVSPTS